MFNKTPEFSDFADPDLRRVALELMHAPPCSPWRTRSE